MNFQSHNNNKQNEVDLSTEKSTLSLYPYQKTAGVKLEEGINTFTKVEPAEPPRKLIKKRRAYELPLL